MVSPATCRNSAGHVETLNPGDYFIYREQFHRSERNIERVQQDWANRADNYFISPNGTGARVELVSLTEPHLVITPNGEGIQIIETTRSVFPRDTFEYVYDFTAKLVELGLLP